MRQIFLDTETTGLSPDNGDRVIELACVELFNRKPTGNNRHYYVNPGRDSHEEALRKSPARWPTPVAAPWPWPAAWARPAKSWSRLAR